MAAIPSFILKKLYVRGSLARREGGFSLRLHNVIAPGTITGIASLWVDDHPIDVSSAAVDQGSQQARVVSEITAQAPLQYPMGSEVSLIVADEQLTPGPHQLAIRVIVKDVGPLEIPISDTVV